MGTLKDRRIVDPVLTELARGYTNSDLVASFLFPDVTVKKEGGKIPQFNKEAFKIYNTERAIRAKSNRINPSVHSSIDYVLTEHDLEYPVDYREETEDALNLKMHATHVVTDGIALRKEKMAADDAQDLSNYGSSSKVTLAGSDQWDDPTSDPIAVIEDAKHSVRSLIAKFPNIAVLGASSYKSLKQHPKLLDKIKYTEHAILTPQLLASLLDFEKIVVGSAVYEDDDGNLVDIWSDNMILAYVPNSSGKRSYYEPSYGYSLVKEGSPFVDSYDEGKKLTLIRNTSIFTSKIVGKDAGYLINDCVS